MNNIAIIQARVGSSRLPQKVLLDLSGRTVLERVIERVEASKLIDQTVVATTISKGDLSIVELCSKMGISVYCGSEDDVLDRYYQAARLFKAETVIRITADCPLIDPEVIDRVIGAYRDRSCDYASNTIKETYPDGEDVEVFSFETLARAWKEAGLKSEREHVTPYIKNKQQLFKVLNIASDVDLSGKRWTIDDPEDYEFIKKVYAALEAHRHNFGMEEILSLLRSDPGLEKLNRHIGRNEGYARSLQEDGIVNHG
jgi:spore coat polysaccharide biosynthesis protein SpsF (cytidylyltransferase family)